MCEEIKTLLIVKPEQILFFTNNYAEGYLIIQGDKKTLLTDNRYYSGINNKADADLKILVGDCESLIEILDGLSVGVDYSNITIFDFLWINSKIKLFDATDYISSITSLKSKGQIECIKKACSISEKAFSEVIPYIREGVSELEIAAELEYRFKKMGAAGCAFDTIVAFGANSAVPHHRTDKTQLGGNQAIIMDFGCKYNGFCSDMTRCLFFGKPSDDYLFAFEAVRIAHLTAKQGITDSMSGFSADKLARDSLKDKSLDSYFTHSLGHGIGVFIHEKPTLSPKSQSILKNGNVFSIEPAVYFNDRFGIRLEDTVMLENDCAKSLMSISLDLIEIG